MEKRLGNNVCKDSFSADEYVNLIFLSLGTCEGASILFPLGKKHMRWNFHSGLLFVRFVLMSALAVPPWTYPEGVCLTPNLGLPFMEDHVCLSMLIPTTPKYCFHFVDGGNSGSEMLSSSSKVTFLVKCPSWDSSLRQLTQHTWSNYSSGCLSQDAWPLLDTGLEWSTAWWSLLLLPGHPPSMAAPQRTQIRIQIHPFHSSADFIPSCFRHVFFWKKDDGLKCCIRFWKIFLIVKSQSGSH